MKNFRNIKKRSWCITGAMLLGMFCIFLSIHQNAKGFPRAMYVGYDGCKIRSSAGVEFEAVGVLEKGEEIIILEAVEGKHDLIWYRIDKESLPERLDVSSVKECYMRSDLLFEN